MLNGNPFDKPNERNAANRTNHFRSHSNLRSVFSAVSMTVSFWSLVDESGFSIVALSSVLLKSFFL